MPAAKGSAKGRPHKGGQGKAEGDAPLGAVPHQVRLLLAGSGIKTGVGSGRACVPESRETVPQPDPLDAVFTWVKGHWHIAAVCDASGGVLVSPKGTSEVKIRCTITDVELVGTVDANDVVSDGILVQNEVKKQHNGNRHWYFTAPRFQQPGTYLIRYEAVSSNNPKWSEPAVQPYVQKVVVKARKLSAAERAAAAAAEAAKSKSKAKGKAKAAAAAAAAASASASSSSAASKKRPADALGGAQDSAKRARHESSHGAEAKPKRSYNKKDASGLAQATSAAATARAAAAAAAAAAEAAEAAAVAAAAVAEEEARPTPVQYLEDAPVPGAGAGSAHCLTDRGEATLYRSVESRVREARRRADSDDDAAAPAPAERRAAMAALTERLVQTRGGTDGGGQVRVDGPCLRLTFSASLCRSLALDRRRPRSAASGVPPTGCAVSVATLFVDASKAPAADGPERWGAVSFDTAPGSGALSSLASSSSAAGAAEADGASVFTIVDADEDFHDIAMDCLDHFDSAVRQGKVLHASEGATWQSEAEAVAAAAAANGSASDGAKKNKPLRSSVLPRDFFGARQALRFVAMLPVLIGSCDAEAMADPNERVYLFRLEAFCKRALARLEAELGGGP